MKSKTKINNGLVIIAGPCSIDTQNIKDIYKISDIKINKKKAVYGTRVVGLKSRTKFDSSGKEMGIDYQAFIKNLEAVMKGRPVTELKMLPSIQMAKKIIQDTNMLAATEIMSPLIQLPLFERIIPKNKLLVWNPAINQLGWPILKMGHYAKKNQWYIGLKNGKWLNMESNWLGMMHFAGLSETEIAEKLIFIQRGVDVYNKGDYRSLPVHDKAQKIKEITKAKVYFDPSHALGPKLRHKIAGAVIKAMKIKINKTDYLYDGILIEVGHSQTDADQHLSVDEFKELCHHLSEIRTLIPPQAI